MQGLLSQNEINDVLKAGAIGRIGCQFQGKMYILPVGYVFDGQRLLCHSTEGLKIRAMRENPEVCFQVDEIENLTNWKSVIVWGRFKELEGAERSAAMGSLIDHLTPKIEEDVLTAYGMRSVTPPSRTLAPGTAILYAIELHERSGRFESTD